MAKEFWDRWVKFYLSTLIPRKMWKQPKQNIKKGDLVLLKDKNIVKNQWNRAWIVKAFPIKDRYIIYVEVLKSDGSVHLHDLTSVYHLKRDV